MRKFAFDEELHHSRQHTIDLPVSVATILGKTSAYSMKGTVGMLPLVISCAIQTTGMLW